MRWLCAICVHSARFIGQGRESESAIQGARRIARIENPSTIANADCSMFFVVLVGERGGGTVSAVNLMNARHGIHSTHKHAPLNTGFLFLHESARLAACPSVRPFVRS